MSAQAPAAALQSTRAVPSFAKPPPITPASGADVSALNLDSVLLRFFEHQIMIKLFHFQTKAYGAHKAADAYGAKFALNMDRFMEAAQGKLGRTGVTNWTLSDTAVNDENIGKRLRQFAKFLVGLNGSLAGAKDLQTIRDEMLADVNQLRYLLTFN